MFYSKQIQSLAHWSQSQGKSADKISAIRFSLWLPNVGSLSEIQLTIEVIHQLWNVRMQTISSGYIEDDRVRCKTMQTAHTHIHPYRVQYVNGKPYNFGFTHLPHIFNSLTHKQRKHTQINLVFFLRSVSFSLSPCVSLAFSRNSTISVGNLLVDGFRQKKIVCLFRDGQKLLWFGKGSFCLNYSECWSIETFVMYGRWPNPFR